MGNLITRGLGIECKTPNVDIDWNKSIIEREFGVETIQEKFDIQKISKQFRFNVSSEKISVESLGAQFTGSRIISAKFDVVCGGR